MGKAGEGGGAAELDTAEEVGTAWNHPMERTTALKAVEAKEREEEMKGKNERGEEGAPGEDVEGTGVDEEGEEGDKTGRFSTRCVCPCCVSE